MIDFLSEYLNLFAIVFLFLFGMIILIIRRNHNLNAMKEFEKNKAIGLDIPFSLHPQIDTIKCIGCTSCIDSCPEGDILKLVNNKAELISPTKCVGHGECEKSCPEDAIKLVFGTKTRGKEIPRISKNFETNLKGVYIVGELGGMGLINNAIKQGVKAVEDAKNKINKDNNIDLAIIGSGPAGFAASLKAKDLGLSYITIEQHKFGGAVKNYPSKKLVMARPVEFPLSGSMAFKKNIASREELLKLWYEIKEKEGIDISENEKFIDLKIISDNNLEVHTDKRRLKVKKVILAIGARGAPRKLEIPGEDLSKVFYQLDDASKYSKKNIAIVGGGNSAVEAAIDLASHGANVSIFIRGDKDMGLAKCHEDNVKKLFKLEDQISIFFESNLNEVLDTSISFTSAGCTKNLANEVVFIFAGSTLPFSFLKKLDIEIDTYFGEAIK